MEIQRRRIASALTRVATRNVALLVAPAASGKSVALEQFISTLEGQTFRFDVRGEHASLARFVRGLAETLEPRLPKVGQSLAIAHQRAVQSARPADVLAAWLAEHLRDAPRTIVIDNFHHCENDPAIAAFIAGVIGHTRPNVRWIIATRSAAELPLAKWLACGDAHVPIDERALKLTRPEALSLAADIAPALEPALVDQLLAAAGGSIGQFVFALHTSSPDPSIALRVLDAGGDVYERSVDEVLASCLPEERRFIIESAPYPDLDVALLTAAGHSGAAERLRSLRAKLPGAFELGAGKLRYKPLFSERLGQRLAALGIDAVHQSHARTGRALAGCGRLVEALAAYVRGHEFCAIARFIETHGLHFVEAGYGDVISEAIDALDPIMRTGSPVVLAIKATFESRHGRFETAESWFQLALEKTTDDGVRGQILYLHSTHLLRFQRPEAVAFLESLVLDPRAEADLLCYARSALGPAYVFERRLEDASAAANDALQLAQASDNRHLRARTYHQAAYVALYRNDGPRARRLAAQALEIAQEQGYFDIAAGALSVLYNVAADIDDDTLETLRLLDAIADCAAKSGTETPHVLALMAKLEIEVERGDDDAIDEADEKLQTVDARSCGRTVYEGLLPAQALRAAWTGDYAGAYHLVAASADQQWSADRKALRWAEIAVFSAAAAMRSEATMAIRSSLQLLEPIEANLRVSRARLFVALAMVLLGRTEAACEIFEQLDAPQQELSPRLRALKNAVEALCSRYRGARNHRALLTAFQELEEQNFGGIGRMIMTCPLADNASLRLGELNSNERRLLAQLTADDSVRTRSGIDAIVNKLGCMDTEAAVRTIKRLPVEVEKDRTTATLQRA